MMTYSFESLTKFVEIVTAPESKSQLKWLIFGQIKQSKDITLLSNQLTHLAALRGHKLVVQPACMLPEYTEFYDLGKRQHLEAGRMPDSLLYGNM